MGTLLFAGWRRVQFDTDYFEDLLGLSLGCRVSLDAVEFPSPGLVRLSNVTFYDSESAKMVLACDRIEARRTAGLQKVDVFQCVVVESMGNQILSSIHDHLLTQPQLLDNEIHIHVDTMDFAEPSHPAHRNPMFGNSTIELRATSSGAEMRACLHPASTDAAGPPAEPTKRVATADPTVEVTIWRDVASPTKTTILFESPHIEFPAHLIAGDRPWRSRLSRQTTFRGRIDCHLDDRGWTVDVLGGDLTNLDLSLLVGKEPEAWLTGIAKVAIRRLTMRTSRIQELVCDVRVPYGDVASDRLENALSMWPVSWNRDALDGDPAVDDPNSDRSSSARRNRGAQDSEHQDRAYRNMPYRKFEYRDFDVRLCLSPDQVTLQPLDGARKTILHLDTGVSIQGESMSIDATAPIDQVITAILGPSQRRPRRPTP